MAAPQRTSQDRARDAARHPRETLEFFEVLPSSRVLELEAGDGYYTRLLGEYLEPAEGRQRLTVLAPFIAPEVFSVPLETGPLLDRWLDLQELSQSFEPPLELLPGLPLESWSTPRFDVVLGIRVAHTYRARSEERAMYRAVHSALLPQGVFGVIAHRAPSDRLTSGYLAESSVIEAVSAAGFALDARSEINGNPKDTRDYPSGVWSLPPVSKDGPAYASVGESDRMTLRFRRVD
ncbi:MAG: class I SAM-dependent methyltransferase [Polyangiaceae bacterium]|nr:class I SAM-dependent methyltransferase [Polyangiaceae bacterium]